MKVFVIATVARQISGEYVFVKVEKGFTQASKADQYKAELKKQYVNLDGTVKPVSLAAEQGTVECICEIGAFEVEIEE